jgi:hypothetical protein
MKTIAFVVHMGVHQRMAWRRPIQMLSYMQLPPRDSSHQILMQNRSTVCHLDNQIIQMGTREVSQWMLSGSVIQVLLAHQVTVLAMMMVML